jgi:hypothetical protein
MKRMMCLLSVLIITALFARPAIADRDDVDDLLERHLAAYNNGDAAALAELYSADAVLLPHEQLGARGRSKIEQFWKRTLRFDPARRMGRSVSTLLMAKKAGSDVRTWSGPSAPAAATPATSDLPRSRFGREMANRIRDVELQRTEVSAGGLETSRCGASFASREPSPRAALPPATGLRNTERRVGWRTSWLLLGPGGRDHPHVSRPGSGATRSSRR